ncbi:MAG: helix-turn-helix domain-containing protein [Burkholderiales bacterium]|nr:helix-turn-helix domain-containing protein [Burkholderiales bacterium]
MRKRSKPLVANTGADSIDAGSLKRGLDILRQLSSHGPAVTVNDVAARPGGSKATARRLLQTLAAEGFLRPVRGSDGDADSYEPGLGCLTLGTAVLSSVPEIWQRQSVLQDLARSFSIDVLVATIARGDALVIAHAAPDSNSVSAVGSVTALEAGALGRCLLWKQPAPRQAELMAAIRTRTEPRSAAVLAAIYQAFQSLEEKRYCVSEPAAGRFELAVPVPDATEQPVLSLACTGPKQLLDDAERIEALRAQLADTARLLGTH